MDLWHGGAPDRKVGDLILPPTQTGFQQTSGRNSADMGLDKIAYRSDRVYVTTDKNLAAAFAAFWTWRPEVDGEGWVYRVDADDTLLENDADLISSLGVSFQVPSAEVVAIEAYRVRWAAKHMRTIQRIDTANDAARKAKSNASLDH